MLIPKDSLIFQESFPRVFLFSTRNFCFFSFRCRLLTLLGYATNFFSFWCLQFKGTVGAQKFSLLSGLPTDSGYWVPCRAGLCLFIYIWYKCGSFIKKVGEKFCIPILSVNFKSLST